MLCLLCVMLLTRISENGYSRDIWNKVCASVSLSLLDKGQRECYRDPYFKAQRFIRMKRIRVLRPVFILSIYPGS